MKIISQILIVAMVAGILTVSAFAQGTTTTTTTTKKTTHHHAMASGKVAHPHALYAKGHKMVMRGKKMVKRGKKMEKRAHHAAMAKKGMGNMKMNGTGAAH